MYMHLSTGICTDNVWKKVFNHDTSGGFFKDKNEVKRKSPYDDASQIFSFLDRIDNIPHLEKPYHFKLCYPGLTQHAFPCNEWTQKKNPIKTNALSSNDYNAINITFASGWTFGIAKNTRVNAKNTILDSTPTANNWWWAVGALKSYETDHTFPGPGVIVSVVELYVKKAAPIGGNIIYVS